MDKAQAAVDQLLAMYEQYKKVSSKQAQLSQQLAKAKLLNMSTQKLHSEYTTVTMDLQKISDKMTFANPIIWIMYKYKAYAAEAQPITTMQDFRIHCSKLGYICTKRFIFVNEALRNNGLTPLSDANIYPDDMDLSEIIHSHDLQLLLEDKVFTSLWDSYEYNLVDGRVAKWENYSPPDTIG